MVTAEEVRKLQQDGKSDQDIISELRRGGASEREVIDAVTQSKIKDAVFSEDLDGTSEVQFSGNPARQDQSYSAAQPQENYSAPQPGEQYSENYSGDGTGEYSGMQPSMLGQTEQPPAVTGYGNYQNAYGNEYPQYQPYQEAISSDMITEISEQVVSERLAVLQDKFEKVIDMKTVMESRLSSVSERLARIEKIMDRLQLSLLQKMGDYVNEVEDVKKELEETQKSFVAHHRKKPAHHETHHEHPHEHHTKHKK